MVPGGSGNFTCPLDKNLKRKKMRTMDGNKKHMEMNSMIGGIGQFVTISGVLVVLEMK